MKYSLLTGVVGAFVLVAACGGSSDHAGTIPDGGGSPSTGGRTSRAGSGTGAKAGTSSDAGGAGQGGAGEEDGLIVTLSSPTSATDPNVDEIIVAEEVRAVCSVVAVDSAVKIDGSSVKIELLDADGQPQMGQDKKPIAATGVPTRNPGEYSADFVTSTIPTGVLAFRCSASSVGRGAKGSAVISTFLDHGPSITVVTPEPDTAHPLEGVMPVEFTVSPALLTDDDRGAAVTKVSLQVAGVDIDKLDEDPKRPGTYRAEIDFTDGVKFKDTPPEHTSVHIEATNSRRPKPVTAINDYPVVVDGKGPNIAYVRPGPNAPVHGETIIEFTADDTGAGIDIDTLKISVTGKPEEKFDLAKDSVWGRTGANSFTYRFDASGLIDVKSQITVTIRADDLGGNSTDGVTLLLYRDDFPPIVDLDPGTARAEIYDQRQCSAAFDPLFDALDDGMTTTVSGNLFRAIIYDQTNVDSGLKIQYMAGADPSSARLYLQPDPSKSFLVDESGDGVCDAIADEKLPYQSLSPVKPGGQMQFSLDDASVEPLMTGCQGKSPGTAPTGLCNGNVSDMTYVVKHNVITGGDEPVVYAVGSLLQPECTGSAWTLHNVTSVVDSKTQKSISLSPDGWVCLAARASDRLGNKGVSRPLRVCFDDPQIAGVPACANGGAPPPTCMTDCTAPPAMPPHIYF